MDEQEVWVRMMAAVLSGGHDVTTDTFARWADESVAEWRKRYGAKAEPAPAPFKPGDLVSVVSGYYKGQDGSVATVYPDDDLKHPGVISVLLPGCAPHFRVEHLKHR